MRTPSHASKYWSTLGERQRDGLHPLEHGRAQHLRRLLGRTKWLRLERPQLYGQPALHLRLTRRGDLDSLAGAIAQAVTNGHSGASCRAPDCDSSAAGSRAQSGKSGLSVPMSTSRAEAGKLGATLIGSSRDASTPLRLLGSTFGVVASSSAARTHGW